MALAIAAQDLVCLPRMLRPKSSVQYLPDLIAVASRSRRVLLLS